MVVPRKHVKVVSIIGAAPVDAEHDVGLVDERPLRRSGRTTLTENLHHESVRHGLPLLALITTHAIPQLPAQRARRLRRPHDVRSLLMCDQRRALLDVSVDLRDEPA
eukprot:6356823-Pyramimonas_sp.AAC.2